MRLKMGRMTKRNCTKYRRRAYKAGMLGKTSLSPTVPSQSSRLINKTPDDLDDKRAA